MTFSNVSSFNSTYKALSAANIAKESSNTIKKGGAFAPNFAEATSIMRASFDNQWENAYIIKYQALMQNRLNALKQELTAAYNNLLQQSASQQIRENGSNNAVSATTDVYGRMLPGAAATTTITTPLVAVNDTSFTVANSTGFYVYDSVTIGNNTYSITNVAGNVISIKPPLIGPAISSGTAVTGGRNNAFKGLKYYGDSASINLADTNGVWDTPGGAGNSATNADGIPSYYLNTDTYQYDNSGNKVLNPNGSENVEMRKLFVAGSAMQIANDMSVTFRSEEVVPKATDAVSFFGGLFSGPPNPNPTFVAGEKVAQYSTEVKTGGFWSTVNYLYDFSPRELKYAYATSYSTTTEESGTRNYTDAVGKKQATLYSSKIVDARDSQTLSGNYIQTDEDATPPTLDAYTNLPALGARVKWTTSNPEDGYLTERNPLINLNNPNDANHVSRVAGAPGVTSPSLDDRLITRRTSDNDTNFPFLATGFNSFGDVIKGNTTVVNGSYSDATAIGTKAIDPWTGFKNSPSVPGDQQANDIKIWGTEEGGVTSMDTRIKWEYQHDGNGVVDTNRDAWIIGNTNSPQTVPAGGMLLPSNGITVTLSAPFAYYNPALTIVGPGTVTIPALVSSIVQSSGINVSVAQGMTITAGNAFSYNDPSLVAVASGTTLTIPAGASVATVPTVALLPPSTNNIPINGITLHTPTAFSYDGNLATTLSNPALSGATSLDVIDSTKFLAGDVITIAGKDYTIASVPTLTKIILTSGIVLPIATPPITKADVGTVLSLKLPRTINVTANSDVTIPPSSTGVIPAGSTYLIPEKSVIKIPAGSTYTLTTPTAANADDTHVAVAAYINHYQVAVQEVELNSNPDSYGKVLALGHTRVNSNVSTSDPYANSADPMNAVATKVLRSGGIDASLDQVFADVDNKYDAQGKLIHQNTVDADGNGQSTNEKMMLPGSGKISKNFTPKFVEGLHQITSFNGQSLGAHGGNITISSEAANSTPVVLGEYEGFKRAQSMSIGLAHDTYNDMGQQVRSYADALALKNKIEAEINASTMVDTDWHYSEYASSTGGSTLDGIMFRNVRKITYNDPDKGVGEFNIYYDQSRRDDPMSNTFQYVDPSTGLSNSMQGTQEDTFDNVNVAFRKTFTLTRDQFQNLDYQQVNPLATNPIAQISPDAYTTDPTYKNRSVKISVDTQNVDTDSLDLVVNGHIVTGLIGSTPATAGQAIYDIAPYLLEGDNVIAFQMRIDKNVNGTVAGSINGKPSATGSNDYFKLTSDASNDTDIASWIAGKISTTRTAGGDINSTELTNATNAGTMLSSWQSKIMSNEVRPSLYESIYPSTLSNPPGADPAKFYVDEFTGQITAEARTTPAAGFYVPGTNTIYTPGSNDIPMTEQAYNSYGAALMGLGSTKTATKVKDSNTFLKVLMEAMNKKEYQDIFALGLLNTSAGKDMVIKGQTSSPSGGTIQSILSIKYDNINNKFSLVQSKWDASGSPQQS